MEQVHTNQMIEAAKRLLDNPDLAAILAARKAELEQDVLLATEKDTILAAHAEHLHLVQFVEWIQHIAEHEMSDRT